jgi:hypothetical protein
MSISFVLSRDGAPAPEDELPDVASLSLSREPASQIPSPILEISTQRLRPSTSFHSQ